MISHTSINSLDKLTQLRSFITRTAAAEMKPSYGKIMYKTPQKINGPQTL